ncbi:hypothetical protein [Priestia megaterium]|uniref:hypothetical protein n=1 Tax=Priestia megaterium TaxID=1404 RepID=UPI0014022081|nr:hypothetical protein [Priestia megaterium]
MSSCRNRDCSCCPRAPKTTITLVSASPTVCTLNTGNNSTVLSGQVLVNGQPAAEAVVEFSITPNLGSVIPLATLTNSSGNFTAVFLSNEGPGVVILKATVLNCREATTSILISIIPCA